MSTREFTDEFGHHVHVSSGSPYNHTAALTCTACIAWLWDKRDVLCEKYGWSEWPEALEGHYKKENRP